MPWPYGSSWIDLVLDPGIDNCWRGERPVRLGQFIEPIDGLVLFNLSRRTQRVESVWNLGRVDPVVRAIRIEPGHTRRIIPGPVAGMPWVQRRDVTVTIRGASALQTCFPSHTSLHVLLFDEDDHTRDGLQQLAVRYARSPIEDLLGPFSWREDPSFPDETQLQPLLYEYLLQTYPRRLQTLLASRAPAPPRGPIPRHIHWIWLHNPNGQTPLDGALVRMMATWLRHNPGFDVHLWIDFDDLRGQFTDEAAWERAQRTFEGRLQIHPPDDIASLVRHATAGRPELGRMFDAAESVAVRSDLLRMLILKQLGGVYCDMNDTECLIPLARLCQRFSFVVGADAFSRVHNAVLASAPQHPLIDGILDGVPTDVQSLNRELQESTTVDEYFAAVVKACGPHLLTRQICDPARRHALDRNVFILPFPYFHNPRPFYPTPLSMVHHHSGMTWIATATSARGLTLPPRPRYPVTRVAAQMPSPAGSPRRGF